MQEELKSLYNKIENNNNEIVTLKKESNSLKIK